MAKLSNKDRSSFFALIDLIPDSVAILDEDGRIVAVNKMASKYVNADNKELVGVNCYSLYKKPIAPDLVGILKKRFSGIDVPPYEIDWETTEGTIVLEVTGKRVQYEGEPFVLIIFHDVTKRNRHQKVLQKTLAESEQKFRDLAEQSPNMIFINQNRKVVYSNNECTKKLGYTKEYFCSPEFNFLDLIVPKYESLCIENFRKHMSGLEIKPYFVQLNSKDGRIINAEINTKLIEYNGKQAILGVVTDVTELKRAQEDIIQSEERLKLTLEAVKEGVWDYNILNMTAFFSPSFYSIFGYDPNELPKERLEWKDFWKNHVHPDDLLRTEKEIREAIAKNSSYALELRMRTKTGLWRWILACGKTVGWDSLGNPIRVVGTIRDITNFKKIQDDFLKSEIRFQKLVELAQEGIWVVDKEYKTTFVNPRMAQMFGYSISEFMEKTVFDVLDNRDVEVAKNFLKEDRPFGTFEFEFPRKDGSHIYVSITVSQFTDDTGQIIGYFSLISDITDRKNMMDTLEKYSRALEEVVEQRTKQLAEAQAQLVKSERLAAIGELAGMVGHDLRNPLTGIKNAVYYLNKNGATIVGKERQAEEMLKIIDKCIEHSNKIIVDLLDYSRDLSLDRRNCLIRQVLDESLVMLDIPKEITIFNHIPDDLLINVDCDKFKRVFINLAKNAIDAMPNGGALTVSSRQNDKNLQICFIDSGIGISKELLPKLFLPLLTTKAQGMGFGLAICKRIIDAHDGKIEAVSEEGRGTTFTITLPIVPIEPKLELIDNNLVNLVDSLN